MRERRDRAGLVVTAGHEMAQRRLALPAADRGAAAREHHALDAGHARGLEHMICADDVAPHDVGRGLVVAGRRGEMHDGVHALERGLDRVEVAEVGSTGLDTRHGAPVERAQRVCALDVPPERAADEAAQPRHENASRCHATPSMRVSGL